MDNKRVLRRVLGGPVDSGPDFFYTDEDAKMVNLPELFHGHSADLFCPSKFPPLIERAGVAFSRIRGEFARLDFQAPIENQTQHSA